MDRSDDIALLLIELDASRKRVNEILDALRARVERLRGPEEESPSAARFRRYTKKDWDNFYGGGWA